MPADACRNLFAAADRLGLRESQFGLRASGLGNESRSMQRRRLLHFTTALCTGAMAAQPANESSRRYSVLSLVGDKLKIITAQMQTGSMLDRNRRDEIAIPDGSIDLFAAQSTKRELSRLATDASIDIFSANSEALYTNPFRVEGNGAFSASQELTEILSAAPKSHTVLLTKHKAEASLRARNSSQGHGKLEGLGFYIDHQQRMRRSDTGETGQGYLGIFVNVHIWLLDWENRKILNDEAFSESSTYSAARGESGVDPWNALDATQKLAQLRSLLQTGIVKTTPKLLKI